MKNSIDDLLIQCYRAVPHRLIPRAVQARITARIAIRNKEIGTRNNPLKMATKRHTDRVIPH